MAERKFTITKFATRKDTTGHRLEWALADVKRFCQKAKRTNETMEQYKAWKANKGNKKAQERAANAKDVGSILAGDTRDQKRGKGDILNRSMLTLDIDKVARPVADIWADITAALDCEAYLYATHSHTADLSSLRLIIPAARDMAVSPLGNEYEAVARKVAECVGIELFDTTTYQVARIMYRPSVCSDGVPVFREQSGPLLDPDKYLDMYDDWRDRAEWPISSKENRADIQRAAVARMEDPTAKVGIVGAFCRAYNIDEAIEAFLSDIYTPGNKGRYTYKPGSSANGLVVYDGGLFAYCHDDTDPAKGEHNSFDLVRLHKYGSKDKKAEPGTAPADLPSFKAMAKLIQNDSKVRAEQARSAAEDFAGIDADNADTWREGAGDWLEKLGPCREIDGKKKYKATIENVETILANDPRLAGRVKYNLFTLDTDIVKPLPWDKRSSRQDVRQWTDRDDAQLRALLERDYGITGKEKINDAFCNVSHDLEYHPVRDYLNALEWDGVPRLDKLIIDYLGAEDTELNRIMTRKHFTAAVARIMRPGIKYDYCLVLTGPEGVGKSTLLATMAGDWFTDSVVTMEGKEGMDALRGVWIIELGELSSVKKADVESVKAFLSKREDIFRAAYAKNKETYKRQCVFCATTNEQYFLKGETGNRRFWVITVAPALRKHKDWGAALKRDRAQLWAEAVHRYKDGEALYLTEAMEAEARDRQARHNYNVEDPLREAVAAFANRPIPVGWDMKDLHDRRQFYKMDWEDPATTHEHRRRFCIDEFMREYLCLDPGDRDYQSKRNRARAYARELEGWSETNARNVPQYLNMGKQRQFEYIGTDLESTDDEDL